MYVDKLSNVASAAAALLLLLLPSLSLDFSFKTNPRCIANSFSFLLSEYSSSPLPKILPNNDKRVVVDFAAAAAGINENEEQRMISVLPLVQPTVGEVTMRA